MYTTVCRILTLKCFTTIYERTQKCGQVEPSIKESLKDLKDYSERFSIFCIKTKNVNLLFCIQRIMLEKLTTSSAKQPKELCTFFKKDKDRRCCKGLLESLQSECFENTSSSFHVAFFEFFFRIVLISALSFCCLYQLAFFTYQKQCKMPK